MPYAAGCKGCGKPCDGVRCDACKAERRAEERARRENRRAHGLCLTCGDPVAQTKLQISGNAGLQRRRLREPAAYCKRHLAYYAARSRAS
jgi:hypothetical protein